MTKKMLSLLLERKKPGERPETKQWTRRGDKAENGVKQKLNKREGMTEISGKLTEEETTGYGGREVTSDKERDWMRGGKQMRKRGGKLKQPLSGRKQSATVRRTFAIVFPPPTPSGSRTLTSVTQTPARSDTNAVGTTVSEMKQNPRRSRRAVNLREGLLTPSRGTDLFYSAAAGMWLVKPNQSHISADV